MIITLRGTNGSGKSTIVRSIMKLYGEPKSRMIIPRRKNPVMYYFEHPVFPERTLMLLGSYESDSGGCDTLPTKKFIYDEVYRAHSIGYDVLYEGVMISNDTPYTISNHKRGATAHCIALNTSQEECISSVDSRRLAKNPEAQRLENPANLINKHRATFTSLKTVAAAGIPTYILNRELAYLKVKELLELA